MDIDDEIDTSTSNSPAYKESNYLKNSNNGVENKTENNENVAPKRIRGQQ